MNTKQTFKLAYGEIRKGKRIEDFGFDIPYSILRSASESLHSRNKAGADLKERLLYYKDSKFWAAMFSGSKAVQQ